MSSKDWVNATLLPKKALTSQLGLSGGQMGRQGKIWRPASVALQQWASIALTEAWNKMQMPHKESLALETPRLLDHLQEGKLMSALAGTTLNRTSKTSRSIWTLTRMYVPSRAVPRAYRPRCCTVRS